ncbi:MAG: GspE/PulE family protein [Planctomycetota bacterium]
MEERRLIGEILKDITDISDEDIDKVLELQMNGDERKLGEILIEGGKATQEDVVAALAEQYEMDIVDLENIDVDKRALDMVSNELAREHKMMPFSLQDDTLMVAISDPLDIYGLDALKFILNKEIRAGLATAEQIEAAQNRFYGMTTSDIETMTKDLSQSDVKIESDDVSQWGEDEDEAAKPVIQLVHLIITEAVKNGASDIHIEPMTNRVRVRYRIDGICYEVDSPPKRLQAAITARLKIMSKLDMSEKRRPQDGRIMIQTAGRKLDLRVSTLPATHGESIVMRILDKASIRFSLESLGFWPDDYKTFQSLCRKPNGVILITGPTGSGKTTTLYSALNELNHVDRKIITAEDPV